MAAALSCRSGCGGGGCLAFGGGGGCLWVSAGGFGVAATVGAGAGCGAGAAGVTALTGVVAGASAGWDFAGDRKMKMKAMMEYSASATQAPAAAKICMRRFRLGAGLRLLRGRRWSAD